MRAAVIARQRVMVEYMLRKKYPYSLDSIKEANVTGQHEMARRLLNVMPAASC